MIEKIKEHFSGPINSIIEIGSAHGKDADYLCKTFSVDPKNVHIIEPRPDAYNFIKEQYPQYNVYQLALSNYSAKNVSFNIDGISGEISSLRERQGEENFYVDKISVTVDTFKQFCSKNKITSMDLVKIDVEGCTYEVLQGFGDLIHKVAVFHLECETVLFWKDQKLKSDILNLLPNFTLVFNTEHVQEDLILINNNCRF